MRATPKRLGWTAVVLAACGSWFFWGPGSAGPDTALAPASDPTGGGVPAGEPSLSEPDSPASTERRTVPFDAIHCKVLEAHTEAPLPDFVVRLMWEEEVVVEGRTDAAGAVVLQRVPGRIRLAVLPRRGWELVEPAVVLVGSGERFVFHARRSTATVLSGQLIDAGTDEALPHYLLEMATSDAGVIEARTDAAGRFELALPRGVSPTELRFVDHRGIDEYFVQVRTAAKLDLPREGEEWQLRVRVGPTYRLDLAVPPDRLGAHRALVLNADQLYELREGFEGWATTPIREGPPTWIRFPERPFTQEAGPWRVFVVSRDGLGWGRSDEITSVEGIYPGIVPVRLQQAGRLVGRVLDQDGQGIAGVQLFLLPPVSDAPPAAGAWFPGDKSDVTGRYLFEWLPPGEYVLRPSPKRHEPMELTVEILAGRTVEQDLVLDALESAGSIRGRVVSRSGRYDGWVYVGLRSKTSPGKMFDTRPKLERDGERLVAEFEFDDLPQGEYEMTVQAGSLMQVTPASLTVRPPADGLEFVIEDAGPLVKFGFHTFDALTGERIPEFELYYSASRTLTTISGGEWGTAAIDWVPADKAFFWAITAKGYAPAYGDQDSFGGDGSLRFAEVQLERGWGVQFNIHGRDGSLAGVTVLLDGQEAGISDAGGIVRVRSAEPPQRVQFQYRDWTYWPDDVDENGRIANSWSVLRIYMRP